ncbi:Uncharacterized protein dnm_073410 [Desulfonema magnum]|uniref:Uncharacterized protein n=1 Tax=Desulfonema magnum TaxID=45655 RepID=A0A975BTL4_9BACT|nr:Uncharacterized protein dnm_073410 [Desulfonema magnum]
MSWFILSKFFSDFNFKNSSLSREKNITTRMTYRKDHGTEIFFISHF